MATIRRLRVNSPVLYSVRWLLAALLFWVLVSRLRAGGGGGVGSWPVGVFDLLSLTLVPALTAFAMIRLFLGVAQSGSGSLNTYTATSSPWSWVFWLFLGIALVGQGSHATATVLEAQLPEVIRNGDFARVVVFFSRTLSFWLLGLGFFGVSAVLLALGRSATQQVFGAEALVLGIGSLLTYGYAVVYIGAYAGLFLPAVAGGAALAVLGLWSLGPYELTRDPVGLLVVPGCATAAAVLLIWSIVLGERPSWPF